jgi:hypothetical protein
LFRGGAGGGQFDETLVSVATGSVVAAVIGVGAVVAAVPGPEYLDVERFGAGSRNVNAARLSVTTGMTSPGNPTSSSTRS